MTEPTQRGEAPRGDHSPAERLLAVSMGDPTGIGPEIIVKALVAQPELQAAVRIFGDRNVLAATSESLGVSLPTHDIVHLGSPTSPRFVPGKPSAASGASAIAYLSAATDAVASRACQALVTAPLAKTWVKQAGFAFPGHTEYLAERFATKRVVMMFIGPKLKVALVTIHQSLASVAQSLRSSDIAKVIELVTQSLERDFAFVAPRVGVVGLNPHAGEFGMIGKEEIDVIAPAIELAANSLRSGASVAGPLVPDVAFRAALDGNFDALVAMYHDQALIPVKLIDFEQAVNVTIGLPIVRTSPDHGTAFDIAGRGIARHTSMLAALELARQMWARRNTAKL